MSGMKKPSFSITRTSKPAQRRASTTGAVDRR